jgi:hypothetical protein
MQNHTRLRSSKVRYEIFDRIGFWVADRAWVIIAIEIIIAIVLIIYGTFLGGFGMRGY